MNALHLAVLATLPGITLAWLYLFELRRFISRLRKFSPDLWLRFGAPDFGAFKPTFTIVLLRGRLAQERGLSASDRRAVTRLRGYLLVCIPLWAAIILVVALRRQFGLTL